MDLGSRRLGPAILLPLLVAALGCANLSPPDPASLALEHAAAGRANEAAQVIEEAVAANPRDAELRRVAARLQAAVGGNSVAIAHLEEAVILEPNGAAVWADLAELERKRENFADAYVAYRRAAELDPEDLRAVSGLALTADQLGFDEEARSAYARWTELARKK